MGIEQLTADILSEAKSEAKQITEGAEAEKKKHLDEEKKVVSAMLAQAEAEAKALVESQRRERVAWARLEGKKLEGEAREEVIRDALDALYEQLEKFRKSKEYGDFLSARIESGIKEIGIPNPVVRVCKGDKKFVKNGNGKAKVVEDLEGIGGAIVESADGSVRVDLTMETLFEDKKEFLRKKLYEKLFR
jgi:vacuolar-type H+-ATPase subunit E/Vma4